MMSIPSKCMQFNIVLKQRMYDISNSAQSDEDCSAYLECKPFVSHITSTLERSKLTMEIC